MDAELIIVGGTTNSEDFGPSSEKHGYMFALDFASNWKWGNYFNHDSYYLSQIDGCQMASIGQKIAVSGMIEQQLVILDINTKDGTVNQELQFSAIFDQNTDEEEESSFKSFGAVYYENSNVSDRSSFYTAFLRGQEMYLVKLSSDPT